MPREARRDARSTNLHDQCGFDHVYEFVQLDESIFRVVEFFDEVIHELGGKFKPQLNKSLTDLRVCHIE